MQNVRGKKPKPFCFYAGMWVLPFYLPFFLFISCLFQWNCSGDGVVRYCIFECDFSLVCVEINL